MRFDLFLLLALAMPGAALAQDAPSKAATSADKFSIDIPAADPAAPPVEAPSTDPATPPAPVVPPDSAPAPAPAIAAGTFSLDTPIADLIADPRAKAVLDKNLPGISSDENLDKFKGMSLRQFAPLTGGQLTPALMTQTAYDLAALTAGSVSGPSASRTRTIGR